MPRKSSRPHRAALTRMLRVTGLAHIPEEAPLVELLRTLADEIDDGGGSRPRIEFRNALRDARAVLNASGRPRGSADVPSKADPPVPSVDVPAEPNDLARFKEKHKIA